MATRASSTPRPTPRPSRCARCSTLPNVTLLVDAEVVKLETDGTGRTVTGVVVSRDGQREVYEGDIVVVSAGASNSAKLLLRSANDHHPNGLANGSDQVGRNYMFHNCKAIVALAKEPNETVFQKTVGLNDFYLGAPDYEWPAGNIQMIGKSNAEAMKGEEPTLHEARAPLLPRRGGPARSRLLADDGGPAHA